MNAKEARKVMVVSRRKVVNSEPFKEFLNKSLDDIRKNAEDGHDELGLTFHINHNLMFRQAIRDEFKKRGFKTSLGAFHLSISW